MKPVTTGTAARDSKAARKSAYASGSGCAAPKCSSVTSPASPATTGRAGTPRCSSTAAKSGADKRSPQERIRSSMRASTSRAAASAANFRHSASSTPSGTRISSAKLRCRSTMRATRSRRDCGSRAKRTSKSVTPDSALTTTTGSCGRARATRLTALSSAPTEPTEVPPNFSTIIRRGRPSMGARRACCRKPKQRFVRHGASTTQGAILPHPRAARHPCRVFGDATSRLVCGPRHGPPMIRRRAMRIPFARAARASRTRAVAFRLALAACAVAMTASRAAALDASEIQTETLPNGMRVVLLPDHSIPNLAMYTFFRVGSRNERPGITGLSHFFEHMMFLGSRNYKPGEFDRTMEASGGANNAFTAQDITCYQDWFPRSALETIFKLESDRIGWLAIDSTSVASERGVVASERRRSVEDNNSRLIDEENWAAAYKAHPYQWPVIGWMVDIEHWKMTDLRRYFETYYAPNNATMVLVGDFDRTEVDALLQKYIAIIPHGPQPPPVTTM